MSRSSLLIALSLVLAPGLLFAQETTVYKTTNADGTNAYSQIDPNRGEQRKVDGRDPALPAAAPKPKTGNEIACERAKLSVEMYASDKVLRRDKNGDGELEVITPDERAAEAELAKRQITAFCPPEG
jgi:hypothetical protein